SSPPARSRTTPSPRGSWTRRRAQPTRRALLRHKKAAQHRRFPRRPFRLDVYSGLPVYPPQQRSYMTEYAIDIVNISKRYDEHVAVRDLTLRVPKGSVYGLLGPNGAGKTTTIRMILNIIAP